MDQAIGDALEQLQLNGLAEITVTVIYNADHGGVMPRSKRFLLAVVSTGPLIESP